MDIEKEDKPRVLLKDFVITDEHGYYHLVGIALNHPILGNTTITTSKLLNVDFKNREAETLNTIYVLI